MALSHNDNGLFMNNTFFCIRKSYEICISMTSLAGSCTPCIPCKNRCWQATVRIMKNLRAAELTSQKQKELRTCHHNLPRINKNQRTLSPSDLFQSFSQVQLMRQFEGKVHKSEPKGFSQEPWGIVPHGHGPKDSSNHPSFNGAQGCDGWLKIQRRNMARGHLKCWNHF